MKQIVPILILMFACLFVNGQVRSLTSVGKTRSQSPGITLTNLTTESVILSDTIKANTMSTYKEVAFRVDCALTSLLVTPNVTVRIRFGNQVITLLSNAGITISQNNSPFVIEGTITNKGATNSQLVSAQVTQNNATLGLSLSSPINIVRGTMAVDTTIDNLLTVTVQFGSAITGTSIVVDKWWIKSDL